MFHAGRGSVQGSRKAQHDHGSHGDASAAETDAGSVIRIGEVAKRSNAADCKSVALAASKVRILPSPPAFAERSRLRLRLASRRLASDSAKRQRADGSLGASSGLRAKSRASERWRAAGLPRRSCERSERWREQRACRAEVASEASGNEGGSNSVVESQPSKLLVAGSIPVSRSRLRRTLAALAASAGRPGAERSRLGMRRAGVGRAVGPAVSEVA